MSREIFLEKFQACLEIPLEMSGNYGALFEESGFDNQDQTNAVFTEKWTKYDSSDEQDALYDFQREWYLSLYGFPDVDDLKAFLADKAVIFDAGCGLGYKAAWFAELAPHALVIGMDFSEAAQHAAVRYKHFENLVFVRGDIANTKFRDGAISYVSCDQVIMHTEDPEATFTELSRITKPNTGSFACYFYAKKALPRELLDDYFRIHCKTMTNDALWSMSEQLTELGKRLSDLNIEVDIPSVPELGITGGRQDLQRFIYWNFLKCFWNADLGYETSISTNFDWYSPSNARRFSEEEVKSIVAKNNMHIQFFHNELACYSGRFTH